MYIQKLYERAPGLIGAASLSGHFVTLNTRWQETLGYPLDALVGARFLDFVHPDDQGITKAAIHQLQNGEAVTHFINRYRCLNGEYVAIEWHSSLGDDGLVYFFAFVVTARVQLHRELQISRDRLAQVADIAGIGGWELDLSSMKLHWDDTTCVIHDTEPGYAPELDSAIEFYAPQARDMVNSYVRNGIQHGGSWDFEAPLITAKGRHIWVRASGRAHQLNGKTIKLSGIFQDITDAKEHALLLEAALKRAEDLQAVAEQSSRDAEAANLAKSQFLANMSHEIRTPLNGMLGMAQLLKRSALNETQKQYLDILYHSGTALRGLIDDILDISRIEAKQLHLINEEFDLIQLVNQTLAIVEPSAAAKGLKVDLNIDETIPAMRMGDKKRLQQVLLNLLGNAIKFTQEGVISVTVTAIDDDGIRFEVEDTGPGIASEAQSRIFDRFAQIDDTRRKEHDGVGLGLAISRELVELANGRIGVQSSVGKGAKFWFEWGLPVINSPVKTGVHINPPTDLHSPQCAQASKKILIAEDKDTNYMVLKATLENAGFDVERARTGLEAVSISESWQPDLIMMDIHMPQLSGDEAIDQIRKHALSATPAIFAVTADATEDTRKRVEALGVSQVFLKPYDLDEITTAAQRALNAQVKI